MLAFIGDHPRKIISVGFECCYDFLAPIPPGIESPAWAAVRAPVPLPENASQIVEPASDRRARITGCEKVCFMPIS